MVDVNRDNLKIFYTGTVRWFGGYLNVTLKDMDSGRNYY